MPEMPEGKRNPGPNLAQNATVEHTDLAAARRVLQTEAQALLSMAESLDDGFIRAVDILDATKGRIIVSGMGKSGHVARKVAATFASTGSPAQFIHPGEASHGDLGMITAADTCLMLSNSGETPELNDLIAHTRRHRIPLIGVARNPASTLLQSADIALVLPPSPEACPMGKAPTTSTTATMALGDALAVALMERNGFSVDEYRLLHPGGQIGKSLIRVRDLMHDGEALPLVTPDTSVAETLIVMTSGKFGCAGVVDGDRKLIGIITDGDLRRHIDGDLLALSARQVMTANPKTIPENALAAEALGMMAGRITCLFVSREPGADPQVPTGILHIHDCLRAGVA